MTERIIQRALRNVFGNYDYVLFNTFIFMWESDFFAISKSGYSVEVEIKCSRADFKKDFTCKTDKHEIFKNHKMPVYTCHKLHGETVCYERPFIFDGEYIRTEYCWVDYIIPAELLPNKFYYACPEGLLGVADVPAYAGLINVSDAGRITEVKKAPFLHKNAKDHTKTLLQKYYWKHLNDRRDLMIMLSQLENHFDSREFTDSQKALIDTIRHKFT